MSYLSLKYIVTLIKVKLLLLVFLLFKKHLETLFR